MVGIAMRPGNQVKDLASKIGEEFDDLVHTYIKIDSDNVVTAIIPHSEMGQGVHTALGQMLAEELDADWDQVKVEEAPAIGEYASYSAGRRYLLSGIDFPNVLIPTVDGMMMRVADTLNMQITGGSLSVRSTGFLAMRVAGAATREMMQAAAAESWGVPLNEVTTENSYAVHELTNRREPYAAFAGAVAEMKPSQTPSFKDPSSYKIVGKYVPRRDIPAKVDGSAKFALDVRVPEMTYASVMRSPVPGGSLVSVDDSAARAIQGVIDVVAIPATTVTNMLGEMRSSDAVAVVADSYWTANKAVRALKITWSETEYDAVSSDSIYAQFDRDISAGSERSADRLEGEVAAAFSGAARVIDADYHVPFLAHTCMEPLNATADVRSDSAEIWVGCQNPLGFRRVVADVLEMDPESVTLNNHIMGGGFGRKALQDYAIQVALLSKAVGRPVQLI